MRPEHSITHERNSSQRGLSIAIYCFLGIAALLLFKGKNSGYTLVGTEHTFVGVLLAGFAGTVSLFAYLLSRSGGGIRSGFWQLIEGMATLVPPTVIAIAVLPIPASNRWWVMLLVFAVGFMGLLMLSDIEFADARPHKFHKREYALFDYRNTSQRFLETIDVVDPQTNLPHRMRGERRIRDGEQQRIGGDRVGGEYRDAPQRYADGRAVAGIATAASQHEQRPQAPKIDGQLKQQVNRFVTRSGDDKVEAIWNVRFERDQKRTVVHVPFSPAFSSRPKIECSVIEGDGVTLKVAEVHPYGVRIEARRTQTTRAAEISIGFHATARAATGRTTTAPNGEFATTQTQPRTQQNQTRSTRSQAPQTQHTQRVRTQQSQQTHLTRTPQTRRDTVGTSDAAVMNSGVANSTNSTNSGITDTRRRTDRTVRQEYEDNVSGARRSTNVVGRAANDIVDSADEFAGDVADTVGRTAAGAARGVRRGVTGTVGGVAAVAGGVAGSALHAADATTGFVADGAKGVANTLANGASGVKNVMASGVDGVGNALSSGVDGVGNVLSSGVDGVGNAISSGVDGVGNVIGGAASGISNVAGGATDMLAGGVENVGDAIAGSASAVTGVGRSLLQKAKRVAKEAAEAVTDPVFSHGNPTDHISDASRNHDDRPRRVTVDPRTTNRD